MNIINIVLRFLLIVIFVCFDLNVEAQQNLQSLLNEFRSSVKLADYDRGKLIYFSKIHEVRNMNAEIDLHTNKNAFLSFQYSLNGHSSMYYTVRIDLEKVKIKKEYNSVKIVSSGGIILSFDTEKMLMDCFTFSCNSVGMRDKIYAELLSIQNPRMLQIEKSVQHQKTSTKTIKEGSHSHPIIKESKHGKYVQ